jgi:hypothetical protein
MKETEREKALTQRWLERLCHERGKREGIKSHLMTPDLQRAFNEEVLRRNPTLEKFGETGMKTEAILAALDAGRRDLFKEGWVPLVANEGAVLLDARAHDFELDAAWVGVPHDIQEMVESKVNADFKQLQIETAPESRLWLSRRRSILRKVIGKGQVEIQVEVEIRAAPITSE